MTTLRIIVCNHCDWQGDEDKLLHEIDYRDTDTVMQACPNCGLGDQLVDITPLI